MSTEVNKQGVDEHGGDQEQHVKYHHKDWEDEEQDNQLC